MPRIEAITSARNPLLQDVRRAVRRGTLTADGLSIAATFHLLEEALRSARPVPAVLATRTAAGRVEALLARAHPAARLLILEPSLLDELAGTDTPQGVVALVEPPSWTLDQLFPARPLLLVLDGVQDPGNAGALVRAAEAFGASGAIFLKGAVSPHHPKTIRAAAGSLFRLPCAAAVEPDTLLDACRRHRVTLFATTPHHGIAPEDAPLAGPAALIIGSEGSGVRPALLDAARPLRIPTATVESLNAATAGAILLYEAARQRRHPAP